MTTMIDSLEPNRKNLRDYAKLGESMGLWKVHEQGTLNMEGERTQRIIISWPLEPIEMEHDYED